ncbi:MAG TPA: SUMF1/EgtB/PvdO family nonheme iron enzyme [Polyangia bacterium]|nr:SUMF1/EgtB/PvdO family nonheme iron enzyme [Polyangia bacterium]
MRRLGIIAALCSSIGCVKGVCYDSRDCPAPQICSPSGACVVLQDASATPPVPPDVGADASLDAGDAEETEGPVDAEAGDGEETGGPIDAEADAAPVCPPSMVAVGNFCIDIYEASRRDATANNAGSDGSQAHSVANVLPWQVGSNAEAALACKAAGKRLCSPAEWQTACEGPDKTVYAYGASYSANTCNGIDAFGGNFHLAPTGSLPECTNAWGVFDMNGNVWEHVAGGTDMTVRGGAYNCGDSVTFHRCDYVPADWTPSAKGFRCCADRNAP